MAGTITHAYFAEDLYKKLDDNTRKKINCSTENLKTYAQGHDIFYFYYSLNLKYGKEIREAGRTFHKKKTKLFFINMINYINNNNNLKNDPNVISFLYGYICHYSLDCTIHPYVTYKSGIFKRNNKETYKYNSKHSEIETYIDSYMIYKNEHINPGKFKVHQFCFNYKTDENLKKLIDYAFKKTYDIDKASNIYFRSLNIMKNLYGLMRYDPYKIKIRIYKFFDKISGKKGKKATPISYSQELNNNEYYLNTNNKKWVHPRYNNEIHHESFEELYNNALDEAFSIINAVNKVIFENMSITYLDNYFLNLSFLSGKDCNDKKINKYFEY